MGKATLTAKEMRKKKENTIKIIVTLVILTAVAALSIWFVLNKDEKEFKQKMNEYYKVAFENVLTAAASDPSMAPYLEKVNVNKLYTKITSENVDKLIEEYTQ